MNLEVAITDLDSHLSMEVTGKYSLSDYKELVMLIANQCEQRGKCLALVNIIQVEGDFPTFDRFVLGEMVSEVFGSRIKMAVLTPRGKTDRTAENTAVNRGARMRVFFTKDEALQWLLSEQG